MFQRAGMPADRASAMNSVWKSVQFPLPTLRQYGMSPSPHPGTLQLANRLVLFPRQRQPELDPLGAGWRREPRLVGEPDRAWPDGVAADGVRPEGGGGEGGEHEGQ